MRQVPAIRFNGFTDPWEQRKLGEITSILSAARVHKDEWRTEGVPFYRSSDIMAAFNGTDNERVFISQELFEELGARSGVPEQGDVMVTGGGSVGTPYIVPDNRPLYTKDADLIWIKHCAKIDPSYLFYFFVSPVFRAYIESISHVGTIAHYTIEQVKETGAVFPPTMAEQTRIGSLFTSLDNLITLHQRKYDQLVVLKKALLDKMFPRDGRNIPELRFAGFTDPWEQRKLGDLLVERNEQAPQSEDYPLMAFIAHKGVAPKGDRYDRSSLVNDVTGKLYKRTEFGDFIYSSNNLETGSIGLNKFGNACISPVYSVFSPTGIADSDFLGRRLVRKDFIQEMVKWRQGVIYGQWRIHESDFIKIVLRVPTVEEQRQIGLLLDQLDNLITLHQRKLELLRNLKAACLDKMFV